MNTLEFRLIDTEQNKAFTMLIRNLNEQGVPYVLRTEMEILRVEVEITTGY